MKYMILTYASQQDYDGMAGQATSGELDFSRQSLIVHPQALMPGDNGVTRGIFGHRVVQYLSDGFVEQAKGRSTRIAKHVGEVILWAESEH